MSISTAGLARRARAYLGVNCGVLLVAYAAYACEAWARTLMPEAAAAAAATAVTYACVASSVAATLRDRRPAAAADSPAPVRWWCVVSHPVGSTLERWAHGRGAGLAPPPPWGGAAAAAAWWATLAAKLFVFELAFDGLFYVSHRAVHAVPWLYRWVHKVHHQHTHDVRLVSTVHMAPLDVALTHTLPVLGALALVPLRPGLELSIGKTYLLYQEFFGHSAVPHKGRNFGPAPWVVRWFGMELTSNDHRRHHIDGTVNFSKRFSLFDKLGRTWRAEKGREKAA